MTNKAKKFDVIVVGAGLAGLMAARLAQKLSLKVAILDPRTLQDWHRQSSRTTAVLQEGLTTLDDLDIAWREIPHVSRLCGLRVTDEVQSVLFDSYEIDQECFGYNIPNCGLAEVICNVFDDNVTIYDETRLTGLSEGLVTIANGEQLAAALVIAADGRGSSCREAAGIQWSWQDSPLRGITARFRHARPHHEIATEIYRGGESITFVPMADPQESALVWMRRNESEITLADLTPYAEADLGAVSDLTDLHYWPVGSGLARRLSAPHLVLIGEAAHAYSPIGAQGFNETLRDIDQLKKQLESAQDLGLSLGGLQVIEGFHRARIWPVRLRGRGIDGFERLVRSRSSSLAKLRQIALRGSSLIPPLKNKLMQLGMGAAPAPRKAH